MRSDTAGIERQYLLDMVDVADRTILEIGCGDGRLTWKYADRTRRVVGIDVDVERLQAGIASRPAYLQQRIDFMIGSAIRMPFTSGTFDHVIFAWSF